MAAPLPPPPPVQEIVVTGQGLATPAGEAAFDVVTIDRARLTGSASGRLEDVLRDVAGFAQYRRSDARSAHPTSQGATLRGLGGNASSRALVVLDGVPQVDPFGGQIDFPAIDPSRLGEIRVTRGGGTGLYGPGALAGTIELTSATPDQLPPLGASLAYGSRNSVDADAQLSSHLGAGFATLSGAYARGDGFVPIVAGQRGPADQPAPYEQASFDARAAAPLSTKTELQANLLAFFDHRNRGLAGTDNRQSGADASVRLVGRGRWGWEALAYLQLRQFSSGFASVNAARTVATETLDQYRVPSTGLGGRIEVRPPLGRRVQLALGADTRRTEGETDELYTYVAGQPTRGRTAGGNTLTAGAFADLSFAATPALTLTAGGRIDRWWIGNGSLHEHTLATGAVLTDATYPSRHGTEPTARGGLVYDLGSGVKLRAAAYLGWRLPTLNELYRPFRAGTDATAANPFLKPERLRGVDGGIDWQPLPALRLSATLFTNRLDDAIGNITLGQGPGSFPGVGFVAAGGAYRMRGNLDAIRSRGVELEGQVRAGGWSLAASYAYVDARVRASGAAASLNGLRPAQTPRHQASATLAHQGPAGIRASATLRYVSDQYEDDENSRHETASTTLDLTLAVPVAPHLSIETRAENVTNTLVEATVAADGTIERALPRTLWIGFRYGG